MLLQMFFGLDGLVWSMLLPITVGWHVSSTWFTQHLSDNSHQHVHVHGLLVDGDYLCIPKGAEGCAMQGHSWAGAGM